MNRFLASGVAGVMTVATLITPASAQFAGVQAPVAATTVASSDVQQAQYRDRYYRGNRHYRGDRYYGRRHYRDRDSGVGVGIAAGVLGLAAGAAIGSSIANDRNRDQSCAARYRSYDPRSGTYLGNDGRRYACR